MPNNAVMLARGKKKKRVLKHKKVPLVSDCRIEARVSEDEKQIIKQAADLAHLSISDFIRTKLVPCAEELISEKEILRLNAEDSAAFVDALIKMPKTSSEKLKKGVAKYKAAKAKGIWKSDLDK